MTNTTKSIKSINYTTQDRALVAILKNSEPMTLEELNAADNNLTAFSSGNLVSAMRKGLIAKVGEKEHIKDGKRKVSTYNFLTDNALSNGSKQYNYTDGEKEILRIASTIDSPFTLAALSEAAGRKINSGSINSLVKKGNIGKGDQVEVATKIKSTVGVYGFVKDIPDEAK